MAQTQIWTKVKYTDVEELRARVLLECSERFAKLFGEPWTQDLRRRLTAGTSPSAERGGKLLVRVHQLANEITAFVNEWEDGANEWEMDARTAALLRWSDTHGTCQRA